MQDDGPPKRSKKHAKYIVCVREKDCRVWIIPKLRKAANVFFGKQSKVKPLRDVINGKIPSYQGYVFMYLEEYDMWMYDIQNACRELEKNDAA